MTAPTQGDVFNPGDAPTLDQIGAAGESQLLVNELMTRIENDPESVTAEQVGVRHRNKKWNGLRPELEKLPERVKVFDRLGRPSMVPLAAIGYHLSKKDFQGNRVFFASPPREYKVEYTSDMCRWCLDGEGQLYKRFQTPEDLETHESLKHELEYQMALRAEQRAARQPVNLLSLIATMSAEEKAALKAILGATEGGVTCDECGQSFAHKGALTGHMRSHGGGE